MNGYITGTTILVEGGVVRSVLCTPGPLASSFTRLSLAYGGHPAGPSPIMQRKKARALPPAIFSMSASG